MPPTPRPSSRTLHAILLLAALWWLSCWFLHGDLGWWNDDYFMSQRDPATGAIIRGFLPSATPFETPRAGTIAWRPMLTLGVTSIVTLLWEVPRLAHLLMALSHLACAIAIWRLLLRLGRGEGVALGGGALYLCWPAGFEGWMWANGWCSGLGTLALVGLCRAWLVWMEGGGTRDPQPGRGRAVVLLALAAVVVTICHEQSAGAVAALPALALAMRPQGEAWGTTIRKIIVGMTIVGIVVATYVGVLLLMRPETGSLGAAGKLAPIARWPEHLGTVLASCMVVLAGWYQGLHLLITGNPQGGAFGAGLATLAAYPFRTALITLAITLTLARWLFPPPSLARSLVRSFAAASHRFWLGLFGVAIVVWSVVPLAMMGLGAPIRPRMCLPAMLGVIVLGGVVWERVMVSVHARPRVARGVSIAGVVLLALACAWGAIAQVGIQRGFQRRWQLDQLHAQQIRTQMPTPSPATVFVPLEITAPTLRTGWDPFDSHFVDPLYNSFAFPSYLRRAYQRDDIDSTCFAHAWEPIVTMDQDALVFAGRMRPGFVSDATPTWPGTWKTGPVRIAWERVVPLVIDETGAWVVTDVVVRDAATGKTLHIQPSQTQGLPRREAAIELR